TIVSEESTFAANENVATVQLVAAGQPGIYTVSYRVVSADGHIVSDKFEYELVDTSAPTSNEPNQTNDASQAAATSAPNDESDGSNGSVVWVLGLGAIGIALVAAMIAVAVRGRRDRTD
ncbi:MAG: copper resistance protein CopC, partial [Actinomycetia bacterium]|nr:copper resistance protein CopC [Actinomycetes bacterium]